MIDAIQPPNDSNFIGRKAPSIYTVLPNQTTAHAMMPESTRMMPELAIVNAARVSYLGESGRLDKDKRLLHYLYKHNHSSPFEMAEFVFCIQMNLRDWRDLSEDSRFRVKVLRFASDELSGFVRVDVNNALKYLTLYPHSNLAKSIKAAFRKSLPWLSEVMGMHSSAEVAFLNQPKITRIPVLDNGDDLWIELQDISGSDEMLSQYINFFNAASRTDWNADVESSIKSLFESDHIDLRPLSMISVKFMLRAPVVVHWQLVRHRTMSFSYQSGRYTAFGNDVHAPSEWRLQSKTNKQGSDGLASHELQLEMRKRFLETWSAGMRNYDHALEQDIAKEQARLFLPAWASNYTAVIKVDLMDFVHFLKLRLDHHAQYEIRQYANAMFSLFKAQMPLTANAIENHIS